MTAVIYYRHSSTPAEERRALARWTTAHHLIGALPPGRVIPRYSVLPFYQDVVSELALRGCRPVNSWWEHRYVADFWPWYHDLEGLTPRSWRADEVSSLPTGSYVVKGATNSRKWLWGSHMLAPTREDVTTVVGRLMDDSLIGCQDTVIRELAPLRGFGTYRPVVGPPVVREYRFFYLDGWRVAGGFYWSNHYEDLVESGFDPDDMADGWEALLDEVSSRIGDRVPFYAVDIAELASGGWTVVEINDGQMSGLSCIDPDLFYRELSRAVS